MSLPSSVFSGSEKMTGCLFFDHASVLVIRRYDQRQNMLFGDGLCVLFSLAASGKKSCEALQQKPEWDKTVFPCFFGIIGIFPILLAK